MTRSAPALASQQQQMVPMRMFSAGSKEDAANSGKWIGELNEQEQIIANVVKTDSETNIAVTMEMDAPDSLEAFRDKLKAHYQSFPRFTSKLVRNGQVYSLEQTTDQDALDNLVTIHHESLDFEGM